MKPNAYISLLLFSILFFSYSCNQQQSINTSMNHSLFTPENYSAPIAKEIPKTFTLHGESRTDKYYWLNERENPDVKAFLEAENKYADSVLSPVKNLKEELFTELKARIKEDDTSVPYLKNDYYYYTRFETGKEYPIYCRKKGNLSAPEQILIDVNILAKGHEYFLATGLKISPDDKYMIYIVDTTGRNLFTAKVADLGTGQLLTDEFSTAGGYDWMADSKTIIYDTKDEVTLRSDKVWRHILGQQQDELMYEEKDETAYVSIDKSKSDEYIFLTHGYTQNVETHYIRSSDPKGSFTLLKAREKDFFYEIDHYGEHFYIKTNKDGAKNFKIMKAPVANPTVQNWMDVIPHDDAVLIEYFDIFKNHLVVGMRKNGLNQLLIKNWSDAKEHFIDFGEPTYAATINNNFEYTTDKLRYVVNSFKTPDVYKRQQIRLSKMRASLVG